MTNKELAVDALNEFFVRRDPSAVDRYVSPSFTQHSAISGDGPEALRDLVAGLGPDAGYDSARVLVDGDLVAFHGRYRGLGEVPLVAFDVLRVADGKLAEHWDALQPEEASTVSGHSQLDGPTEVTRPGQTEESRRLVTDFVESVLVGEQYDRLSSFIDPQPSSAYIQHSPGVGDGLTGLGTAIEEMSRRGVRMEYYTMHRAIADGEFVLTQSEGRLGGMPTAYYDLFRVDQGKIVEHWDVIVDVPVTLPHDNGLF